MKNKSKKMLSDLCALNLSEHLTLLLHLTTISAKICSFKIIWAMAIVKRIVSSKMKSQILSSKSINFE
jgi:hypothetical protein